MIKKLLKDYKSNNIRALAKLLTFVESRKDGYEDIMSSINPEKSLSYCLGITGPPGAGKSTLVDQFVHILRKNGKKVGIIAIDPSSPFSGGAVLGDRIRMQSHAADDDVFIRSVGSRGSHGGLSRATRDIVKLMKGFGFDYVIVETVGVGQTELDIMELADTTVVVLVPEAGDTIQTMKAGLLEIADIFVVNKSDRPGSDSIFQSLIGLVELDKSSGWKIPVIKTEALKNSGIDKLHETVIEHASFLKSIPKNSSKKLEMKKSELIQIVSELLEKDIKKIIDKIDIKNTDNLYKTAQKILNKITTNNY